MFLMSFIRHADSVKIANLAQLVNVIGPLLTRGDDLLKQSIFYAFRMVSARKGGVSLRSSVDGPGYTSERYGAVNYLDQAAVIDGDRLHVFALNRHVEDAMELTVECADREIVGVADSEFLHADLKAENTFDVPDVVTARAFDGWIAKGTAAAELPPHAFVATTFRDRVASLAWLPVRVRPAKGHCGPGGRRTCLYGVLVGELKHLVCRQAEQLAVHRFIVGPGATRQLHAEAARRPRSATRCLAGRPRRSARGGAWRARRVPAGEDRGGRRPRTARGRR